MILNLLITRKEWDDHKTDYFAVSSLCPIISRQPPSGTRNWQWTRKAEDPGKAPKLEGDRVSHEYHIRRANLMSYPARGLLQV